jgi:cobalamin biosynthesis protein CobD/CbiB
MFMSRTKRINLALLLTSFAGYLEWGGGSHGFLLTLEAEVLKKLFSDPIAALHPFTVLPLLGQILLMATLLQKEPSRLLTVTGLICLGLLLLMIFLIGILTLNLKILLSAVPFLFTTYFAVRNLRRKTTGS